MTESPLITAGALASRLGQKGLAVLDASWHMPNAGRDAKAEFLDGHIPGARFFDIDAISDRDSPYPHMLAQPSAFEAAVRALGVDAGDEIVVYDSVGLFSAPRAWWNFRVMGAGAVRVLDGGLPAWRSAGLPVDSGMPGEARGSFVARFRPELVRSYDQIVEAAGSGSATIIDARAAARFRGEAPEPRPGLPSGHIAGSRNVPFGTLVDADGRLKPAPDLLAVFASAGVDPAGPLVASCGSGVTAAIDALALAVLGREDVPIYDGSWSEFAVRNDGALLRKAD